MEGRGQWEEVQGLRGFFKKHWVKTNGQKKKKK